MYILDLEDFYRKSNEYFGSRGSAQSSRGSAQSFSPENGTVQLLLYGSEVFYLGLPNNPREGITFQYEVAASIRTQDFFGVRLSGVENTREDVESAFDVIDNFARLHLPDKYLQAWDDRIVE